MVAQNFNPDALGQVSGPKDLRRTSKILGQGAGGRGRSPKKYFSYPFEVPIILIILPSITGLPIPRIALTATIKFKLLLTYLLLDQGPTTRPGISYQTRTQLLDKESITRRRIYYCTRDLLLDKGPGTGHGIYCQTRDLVPDLAWLFRLPPTLVWTERQIQLLFLNLN